HGLYYTWYTSAMNSVKTAWFFDVDGVLTNPEVKIANPEILSEIARMLGKGDPVALVTGRSVDFMRDRVIAPLKGILSSPNLLRNFLAVGEKGGAWISYDGNGEEEENIDSDISVTQELVEKVKNLIDEEFSDVMFFDGTKKTMISTEMNDGEDLEKYHRSQQMLKKKLEQLVDQSGMKDRLDIDPTTIATDIQSKHVGKDFAARRVMEWLSSRKINPLQFVTIGDSKSDIPMAQEVHDQGFSVTMVFVGKPQDVANLQTPFPLIKTANLYEKGTLEYLQNYS
ncbi:MAG: HAD-IIB family hydrolase, partial [Candidatus Levyibacteriota bacterium]